MLWNETLLIMLGGLVLLLAIGIPVAVAFIGVNIVGAILIFGGEAGLKQLALGTTDSVSKFSLAPVPLFILMGEVLLYSRLAERAIDAIERLVVGVPGRLSFVAVASGTVFSSLSGSTMANTAILGNVLLPQMQRLGYHPSMSVGPILGTGGIAMLIPPSALAVLLGSLSGISISQLLIAGLLPGLLVATLFMFYIVIRCLIQPEIAPKGTEEVMPWSERLKPFFVNVLPLIIIFVVVVGSILGGYATPTESAALGSVATFIATALYGRLSFSVIYKSLLGTAKITAMILIIIAGSITFSQILSFSGATAAILEMVQNMNLTPAILVLVLIGMLLVMGAFLDQLSMMMITLPFFMPIVNQLGVDPVWFGILMLLALEIGLTTPPFGMLLFVMKSVAPSNISMKQIYGAATPFIMLELIALAIIFIFPAVAIWLPSQILR